MYWSCDPILDIVQDQIELVLLTCFHIRNEDKLFLATSWITNKCGWCSRRPLYQQRPVMLRSEVFLVVHTPHKPCDQQMWQALVFHNLKVYDWHHKCSLMNWTMQCFIHTLSTFYFPTTSPYVTQLNDS